MGIKRAKPHTPHSITCHVSIWSGLKSMVCDFLPPINGWEFSHQELWPASKNETWKTVLSRIIRPDYYYTEYYSTSTMPIIATPVTGIIITSILTISIILTSVVLIPMYPRNGKTCHCPPGEWIGPNYYSGVCGATRGNIVKREITLLWWHWLS